MKVTLGSTTVKSETQKQDVCDPVWNQKLAIPVLKTNRLSTLKVAVKNNGLFKCDLLGQGEIDLEEVFENGYKDVVLKLKTKMGKQKGQICMTVEYERSILQSSNGRMRSSKSRSNKMNVSVDSGDAGSLSSSMGNIPRVSAEIDDTPARDESCIDIMPALEEVLVEPGEIGKSEEISPVPASNIDFAPTGYPPIGPPGSLFAGIAPLLKDVPPLKLSKLSAGPSNLPYKPLKKEYQNSPPDSPLPDSRRSARTESPRSTDSPRFPQFNFTAQERAINRPLDGIFHGPSPIRASYPNVP